MSIFSDHGRENFLKGCEELEEGEINKRICKQILRAIASDMRRMMDKHLRKMKEMHRDLMRH
ncbi:MAG: hypothetical protein SNF33_02060 [Candidatus Algichlamydia australiensis]|nr:hypothetical protein [Chlamydiales bacterium]